jgi:hypothetical protein
MARKTELAKTRPHLLRRLLHAFLSRDSYGLVLLLIVLTYTLAVSLSGWWASTLVLLVQVVTVSFALRTSRARRSLLLIARAALAAAVLVAAARVLGGSDVWLGAGVITASSILYLITPFSIVHHLAVRPAVDQQAVFGAVAAYLLIGMFFAFVFRFLALAQSGSFFVTPGVGTMDEVLFFSFTTLTTTGYGNLVPAGNPGQSLAVAEMVLGQLFLVTAVAKLVSEWRPKRQSPEGPVPDDRVGFG